MSIFWKNILMIACICSFSSVLEAQQVVTGRITDATDGTPVQNAQIFIANTSLGTVSDASGKYSITVPIEGSFGIAISRIGYQPAFHDIAMPKSVHQYDVALKIKELDEVIVQVHRHYRKKDVDLFWSKILGEKPSEKGMQVLNPGKIYCNLNEDNVLRVSCQEPIEIVNHSMGYRIRYILKSFQHDYRSNTTTFAGMPCFEELTPQNSRQKSSWEKRRQAVYAVSINRFLRALYQEQLHEEGFLLLYWKRLSAPPFIKIDSSRMNKNSPLLHDAASILNQPRQMLCELPVEEILQRDQDKVQVTVKSPLFLICYAKPVTAQMIQTTQNNFHDVLTGSTKSPVAAELLPQQITVYSDGTYTGMLEIHERQYPIYGLSSIVPVEYGDEK